MSTSCNATCVVELTCSIRTGLLESHGILGRDWISVAQPVWEYYKKQIGGVASKAPPSMKKVGQQVARGGSKTANGDSGSLSIPPVFLQAASGSTTIATTMTTLNVASSGTTSGISLVAAESSDNSNFGAPGSGVSLVEDQEKNGSSCASGASSSSSVGECDAIGDGHNANSREERDEEDDSDDEVVDLEQSFLNHEQPY